MCGEEDPLPFGIAPTVVRVLCWNCGENLTGTDTNPVLAGRKPIAEAWDAGGLYQVGSFGGDRWKEWNGRFRDGGPQIRRHQDIKATDPRCRGFARDLEQRGSSGAEQQAIDEPLVARGTHLESTFREQSPRQADAALEVLKARVGM